MLDVAFLGVTHPHADAWASAAHEDPRTRITRVYDPDPTAARSFAEKYAAESVRSADEALRGTGAAVVDGRNDEAPRFAEIAIGAGVPVFIEKTGARTSARLAEVADRASRAGVLTQMGYFMRYSDSVVRTRQALEEGALGDLYLARFHAAIPHQAWTSMAHWFSDASNVVTPFMEAGCHLVDVLRLLLGEPHEIRATRVRRSGTPSPGEDALAATMRCADTVVTIDFTAHEADPWNIGWGGDLFGDAATLRFGVTPARTSLGSGGHVPDVHSPVALDDPDAIRTRMSAENAELMRRGMSAFIDAVDSDSPSPVDAESGAATLRLIEDALKACDLPAVRPEPFPAA
ncbi:Gfo/Idh/MocA family protein [Ruania alba]|uniref:Oxidoreductase family, NAD-binding Rossmann fold n=1 Tax=Ruania alba TaxID=648782 RepID=A0A1H5GUQ2_9MICO|nr:Gfo/Idh/MocA family oxidoreductase [Ruania alba]SEE19325.1 Oxidoreductase family, NAD-binding Rossmann fold [Ruania alba]